MQLSHKVRQAIIGACAALAVVIAGAGMVSAAGQSSGGTTNATVYRFGRDVSVTGTINGDVICGGQNVTIDATVNGDVICAGQTVNVNGNVNGSVRAAGQDVTIHAKVARNVSLAGQSITVNGQVAQDASLAGTDIFVSGIVGRDLRMKGDDMTISGSVGRNVFSNGGDITLDKNASIAGTLSHTGPRAPHQIKGSTVAGKVAYTSRPTEHHNYWQWFVIWKIFLAASLTVLTLLLVALLPRLFRRTSTIAASSFWWVLLTGLVASIVVPFLILSLGLTVIGIVPAIFLFLVWALLCLASGPVAAFFIGNRLAPDWHPVLSALLGCAVIGLVSLIPILGEFVSGVVFLLGLGTLLWGIRYGYKQPNYTEA
jgi:hypothetical protein